MIPRLHTTFFFLALIICGALPVAAQDVILGGFPSVAPWIIYEKPGDSTSRIQGGIIPDLEVEVSRRTGLTFRYYFPPRRRMEEEIRLGKLDITPMANPLWLTSPEVLNWSPVIFRSRKVFVTRVDFPREILGPADLNGVVLGGNTGYVYPEIEKSWGLVWDEADTVVRNLKKLELGRIDGVYLDEEDAFFRMKDFSGLFKIHSFSPGGSDYHWAISKSLGDRGPQILKVLELMIRDGTVNKILSRYKR